MFRLTIKSESHIALKILEETIEEYIAEHPNKTTFIIEKDYE